MTLIHFYSFMHDFRYNKSMKNVLYRDIANLLDKSEGTIKNWKKQHPVLLELTKIGAFCKLNDLDIEKIRKLIELQEMIKRD